MTSLLSPDIVLKCENVSKKFCLDLGRSLKYGIKDIAQNALSSGPYGKYISCSEMSHLRDKEFWVFKDVSFELRRGECLGLVGRNGAGKTTLLKILNGLIKPDSGKVSISGSVGALIALGAGFNPILTGRENIYSNAAILGMNRREVRSKIDEIIEFSEIEKFIDSPVQTYSSGMQVRLGFSIAVAAEAEVILVDEVLAVGDARFRNKCYSAINKLRQKGASFILVTHSEIAMKNIADKVLYMTPGTTPTLYNDVSKAYQLYNQSSLSGLTSKAESTQISSKIELAVLSNNVDNYFGWKQKNVNTVLKCGLPIHIGLLVKCHLGPHVHCKIDLLSSENSSSVLWSGTSKLEYTTSNNSANETSFLSILLKHHALSEGQYGFKIHLFGLSFLDSIEITDPFWFDVVSNNDLIPLTQTGDRRIIIQSSITNLPT